MPSELHLAAVRALLAGDVNEHLRLVGEIDREGSVQAYGILYKVAFLVAVRRRFGAGSTRGDVIRFVAHMRAEHPQNVEDVGILAAERLLLAMLGDETALRRLTEDESALVGPLLLELGKALPAEEVLAGAVEMTRRLEAAAAGLG